jgi:rhodanese-related sulfurtransferase
MSYATKTPQHAKELLDTGWTYVDVRTVEEFDAGHPTGAFNVPIFLRDASGGMVPNPAFGDALGRVFARETKIVFGCRSGQRSARACEVAAQLGFGQLVNMSGGFVGGADPTGRATAGWQELGLPTSTQPANGRSWRELAAKK